MEAAAQEIINANPKEVADYKAGKTKVMGFFVGQLMKKTKGQANPQLANEIFQRLLGLAIFASLRLGVKFSLAKTQRRKN